MTESLKETAVEIAKILDNKKGKDVKVLDVRNFSSLTDFFIIATGNSTRHTTALADEVEENMEQKGIFARHKEGYNEGNWILLDYLDVVVNIFTEQEREFYDLERIWKGAKYVELDIDTT